MSKEISKAGKEKFRPEDLRRLQEFRLMDDDFMVKCFEEDIDCIQMLLDNLLDLYDLKIKKVAVQKLQCRSIILDIHAMDYVGKRYNVKVQTADHDSWEKRQEYYLSLMAANETDLEENPENLIETYLLLITEHDVFGLGEPIYHVDEIIREGDGNIGDNIHILYANGDYRAESPKGLLLHDFSCTDAKDMRYKVLADRVKYFKEDERGVAVMCKAMEDMRNEAAIEEGRKIAFNMLSLGKLSYEEIAGCTELSVEEVKELAAKKEA